MNISLEETIRVETSPSSELISNQLSLDDPNNSEQFDASPIEDLLPSDSSLEIVSIDPSSHMDISREHTTSESSSDTVDYQFETEICHS